MSFPRYPKYKPSGVEWLGEVPAHWEVDRFKRSVADCRNGIWGDEPAGNDSDVICIRVADFDRQALRVCATSPTVRSISSFDLEARALAPGDLLLEKSGGGENQPVGCVVLYDGPTPAICSNFVARMRLDAGMHPSFWRYQHAAAYAVRLNTRSIKQTSGLQNLDQQQYLDEQAAFPPALEQRVIADFLDRETAKLDALIAEQERLIELLKEKRQAIISHAVTKGLNSDAPMKESGIAWLGRIPAHWSLPPLYVRYHQALGKMLDQSRFTGDHATPYLRNIDVRWDRINTDDLPVMDIHPDEKSRYMVRRGDLLMVEGRELGRCAIWQGEDNIVGFQKALHRLRPMDGTEHIRFFFYTMHFANSVGVFFADNSPDEIPHLTGEELRRYRFPKPPIREQVEIADELDRQTAAIDRLIDESQKAIAILGERRTALITAAVTGQIDVRSTSIEAVA